MVSAYQQIEGVLFAEPLFGCNGLKSSYKDVDGHMRGRRYGLVRTRLFFESLKQRL